MPPKKQNQDITDRGGIAYTPTQQTKTKAPLPPIPPPEPPQAPPEAVPPEPPPSEPPEAPIQ